MKAAYVPDTLTPVQYKGSLFRFRSKGAKYAYIAFLLLVIWLSLLVIIANLFEGPINRRVIAAVKTQLKTELKIQGMSLSLIRAFPHASVDLRGVILQDTRGQVLLAADRISLELGLLSLLGSRTKVRSLVVEDGRFRVHLDQKGRPNYLVFQPSQTTTASKGVAFSLEAAYVNQVRLIYTDERDRTSLDITCEKAQAKGDFTATRFVTDSQAALQIHELSLGGVDYMKDKKLSYTAEVAVDLDNQIYRFTDASLQIASGIVGLEGAFQVKKDYTWCDVDIRNKRIDLPALLQWLPGPYAGHFKDFESKGKFDLSGKIKGRAGKTFLPDIQIAMQMRNATLSSPGMEEALRDVGFKAVLQHSKTASFFEIKEFKGAFGKNPLDMRLKVTDLKDPHVDFRFNGVFPLASIAGLLGNPAFTEGEGDLVVDQLQLKGKYRDMIRPARMSHVLATGNIAMREAALRVNGEPVDFPSGILTLDNNRIQLDSFRIEGAGTSLVMNGYCKNLIPVLFADSLNSQDAVLDFDSRLYARALDLDKLLLLAARQQQKTKPSANSTQTNTRKRVSPFRLLKGTFDAQIDSLNYDLITTSDFSGQLQFEAGNMYVNGDLEGMDGVFNVEGVADLDLRKFEAAVDCNEVNITEFFRQCRNFYQTFIEDKNLKGQLNARMLVRGTWNQDLTLNQDQLHVFADLTVRNGELIRFKMLDYFSKYIKIQDLQHIRFTTLRNWVEIKRRTIYMPAIFVQSNAANLTFSGSHTFDQRINYYIKVNAGQVLVSKLKRHDQALQPQPAEKGWFNLFYHISGTTDKYTMRYTKNTVTREFEASQMRKQSIQQELAAVFGSSSGDEDSPLSSEKPASTAGGLHKNFPFLPRISPKKQTVTPPTEEEDYYIPGF